MDELKAGVGKIVKEEAIWREDCEKAIMALHNRVKVLEDAVIAQQKMMEAVATDVLTPQPRIIRAS